MRFWAGASGAGQVIRRLPSLTVDPTKAPAPTDSAKKCVLSAVRGRLSERVFVRGVPRRAMRAGSPSAMRGQSSPVGDIVPDIRYCRCEVERRRCAYHTYHSYHVHSAKHGSIIKKIGDVHRSRSSSYEQLY